MGISGLLPLLKSITRQTHVSSYKGKKVAVDGYSWLHKGAYGCSRELSEGAYTEKFVWYCLQKIEMLRSFGVEPLIVFDGGPLPMKAGEEMSRQRGREENRSKGMAHLRAGNTAAAEECFAKAVDISPGMAKQLIEALKERGVEYLVAPYEADAQLAYLAQQGDVWAILTEDSDLLAYGCPRVLYKLDRQGNGEEVLLANLESNEGASLMGFTHAMFVAMCVMAGCDFLDNLPGIGIKKAHASIKKFKSWVQAVKSLRFSGVPVPRDYEQRFQQAMWVFRHQRVYCPRNRRLVTLQPLPVGGLGGADVDCTAAVPQGDDALLLSFLGPVIEPDLAEGIAKGDLDPNTLQPFDLAALYRGCGRPPAQVALALGLSTEGGSDQATGTAEEATGGFGGSQHTYTPMSDVGSRFKFRSGKGFGASRKRVTAAPVESDKQANSILKFLMPKEGQATPFLPPRPASASQQQGNVGGAGGRKRRPVISAMRGMPPRPTAAATEFGAAGSEGALGETKVGSGGTHCGIGNQGSLAQPDSPGRVKANAPPGLHAKPLPLTAEDNPFLRFQQHAARAAECDACDAVEQHAARADACDAEEGPPEQKGRSRKKAGKRASQGTRHPGLCFLDDEAGRGDDDDDDEDDGDDDDDDNDDAMEENSDSQQSCDLGPLCEVSDDDGGLDVADVMAALRGRGKSRCSGSGRSESIPVKGEHPCEAAGDDAAGQDVPAPERRVRFAPNEAGGEEIVATVVSEGADEEAAEVVPNHQFEGPSLESLHSTQSIAQLVSTQSDTQEQADPSNTQEQANVALSRPLNAFASLAFAFPKQAGLHPGGACPQGELWVRQRPSRAGGGYDTVDQGPSGSGPYASQPVSLGPRETQHSELVDDATSPLSRARAGLSSQEDRDPLSFEVPGIDSCSAQEVAGQRGAASIPQPPHSGPGHARGGDGAMQPVSHTSQVQVQVTQPTDTGTDDAEAASFVQLAAATRAPRFQGLSKRRLQSASETDGAGPDGGEVQQGKVSRFFPNVRKPAAAQQLPQDNKCGTVCQSSPDSRASEYIPRQPPCSSYNLGPVEVDREEGCQPGLSSHAEISESAGLSGSQHKTTARPGHNPFATFAAASHAPILSQSRADRTTLCGRQGRPKGAGAAVQRGGNQQDRTIGGAVHETLPAAKPRRVGHTQDSCQAHVTTELCAPLDDPDLTGCASAPGVDKARAQERAREQQQDHALSTACGSGVGMDRALPDEGVCGLVQMVEPIHARIEPLPQGGSQKLGLGLFAFAFKGGRCGSEAVEQACGGLAGATEGRGGVRIAAGGMPVPKGGFKAPRRT